MGILDHPDASFIRLARIFKTACKALLRRSCDQLGQTVIMVTHDPGAAAYADRVVLLHDGSIIEEICFGAVEGLPERVTALMGVTEKLPFSDRQA